MKLTLPKSLFYSRKRTATAHYRGRQMALRACTLAFLLLTGSTYTASAQLLVSTVPQNKNFLIEKGTGHTCGSCPGIERRCDTVLAAHPGRGMLIAYHIGPDALPQATLPYDFRTPYGDTIGDLDKLNWPFYLNMMMNRRDQGPPYGSTFTAAPDNMVQDEADAIVTQPSPVNLYLSSTFDSNSRLLTVQVQAYYTATSATAVNYLQLALTEDSISSTQYDSDYPVNNHYDSQFVFMNVFRDNLNGFNGDTVTTTATGEFISRTYTYTIPAAYKNIPCNPQHCNLTLYMAEEKAASGQQSFTGKIITTTRAKVGNGNAPTSIATLALPATEVVYPNPSTGIVSIAGIAAGNYTVTVCNVTGSTIYHLSGTGGQPLTLDLKHEPAGVYFIKINTGGQTHIHRLVLAN